MIDPLSFSASQIESIIPHSGHMSFWEQIIDYSDQHIVCKTGNHLKQDHPLKKHGKLSAIQLIEFAAQSVAIHGALYAKEHKIGQGYLASLKKVRLFAFNETTRFITCSTKKLIADETTKLYQFELKDTENAIICQGQALIVHPELFTEDQHD